MAKTYATSSHLTAITRITPSVPARKLHEAGLLQGRTLDYGCGKGKDADVFKMNRYDPHYAPLMPPGVFDTITCTYVLNVVPPEDVPNILKTIHDLLAPGGTAYVTVRRDLSSKAQKGRGTTQRNVTLDLPILKETRGYCTYIVRQDAWQFTRGSYSSVKHLKNFRPRTENS